MRLTIKTWRVHNGYTQTRLAEALGVTQATIWNWENKVKKPHPKHLQRLADLFLIDVKQIEI